MRVEYRKFKAKRRFGVELEVNRKVDMETLADTVAEASGRYTEIADWHYTTNNKEWIVKTDSTCGDFGDRERDGGGFEICSPADKGAGHLLAIGKVTKALNEAGVVVNDHCGFHCQVEIKDFKNEDVAKLMAYWIKIEPIISQSVPNRRVTNKYCKLLTHKLKLKDTQYDPKSFWQAVKLKKYGPRAKRTALTIVNYQRSKSRSMDWSHFNRCTVEIRLPEGSLNPSDTKNWSRLFVHFVDHVKNLDFPSDMEPVGLKKTFKILGLYDKSPTVILSPGLHETRMWLLRRILTHSRSKRLITATDRLKASWTLRPSKKNLKELHKELQRTTS